MYFIIQKASAGFSHGWIEFQENKQKKEGFLRPELGIGIVSFLPHLIGQSKFQGQTQG